MGFYRLFCRVAFEGLKSLPVRLFLRVNVKGHFFHQETPELPDWQCSPWRGNSAVSHHEFIPYPTCCHTQVGNDKIMLVSDSYRELQHLLAPSYGCNTGRTEQFHVSLAPAAVTPVLAEM